MPKVENIDRVYEILELEKECTFEELEAQWKLLKKKFHQISLTALDYRTQIKYQDKEHEVDEAYLFLQLANMPVVPFFNPWKSNEKS